MDGQDGISISRAEEVFRLVNTLYQDQRDVLTELETEVLRGIRDRMTDILCPYPVSVLEEDRKQLDERFPDREHRYIRCGKTVTWSDRRKDPADAEVGAVRTGSQPRRSAAASRRPAASPAPRRT